ncbi:MAG: 4Fe-4S binding protein [Spirochaetes bacterium]|nr:4Fe-4S binding protein [Spirochaetota bacterium]
MFSHGPGKRFVRLAVWLSWPIIRAAKKWSALPVLKWIINPFFSRPFNEVTSVPISVDLSLPASVPLPRNIVERLVGKIDDKFILDECICRTHNRVTGEARRIGCIALGPAIRRLHPSHGRRATTEEAIAHIRRAGEMGLIANIAHVWIDPLAFMLSFKDLMFICFCDDVNCIYRTHMQKRGPNLDTAYKKLPGITVAVVPEKCDGCERCVDACFVTAIRMSGGKAVIGEDCKGCGRCVEICPAQAITLKLDDEEKLLAQLEDRIREVADIPGIASQA